MPISAPHSAIQSISQASDPKKAILEAVGDLSGVQVSGNMVLVGQYVRPERTAGGIIRPDSNKEEDVWQGKCGLILKLGPRAYVDDDEYQFYGERFDVGDWGVFKIGDAWQLLINKCPCRLVRDSSIRLKVKDPSIIL